ncbi:MAG: hypothetical protein MK066_04690 [Crocinitomicaceae bacterium]|nr:hypothetical protein [Crocinitomicaceae bacterium]
MRTIYLIFMCFFVFSVSAQKNYQLEFTSPVIQSFIKHPKTIFNDSLDVITYLRDLQLEAITKGYLTASIDEIVYYKKKATVSFYLGEQYKNAQLNVPKTERSYLRKKINLSEKFLTNLPFTPNQISKTLKRIHAAYFNSGYPFASVKLDNIQLKSELIADINIQKGPYTKWTKIHLKGDSSIAKNYIASLIGIKKGDPFNGELLDQISDKIKQVPFLKEIKTHDILFTKKGAELYLYMENIPISSINGIVGFQPDPVDQKLSVTGELSLKLLNVLKRGELLNIRWQSIRDQTQSLNSRVNYPFIFKTPFGLDGTFNLYKSDTSFLELNSSIGVQYFMRQGSYLKAFYKNTSSSVLSGGKNNPDFKKLGNVRSNNYGLSYYRQRLDYLPNPSRGTKMIFTAITGSRKSQLSDTSQSMQSVTFRATIDIELYLPITRRHVFRIANLSEAYSADNIFENEVYRFGGLGAQRGFNEDELLATTRNTTTLEYRFLLDKNSHVFAFYDQTWYENNTTSYHNDSPFGFGVGFSFSTNLGIFSISYALGKQLNNTILLSDSKVHFGYIAYF